MRDEEDDNIPLNVSILWRKKLARNVLSMIILCQKIRKALDYNEQKSLTSSPVFVAYLQYFEGFLIVRVDKVEELSSLMEGTRKLSKSQYFQYQ